MQELIYTILKKIKLSHDDRLLLNSLFTTEIIPKNALFLKEGMTEKYVYFLNKGIVKGYQNIDGKMVVQHLISSNTFFTSFESFTEQTPSKDFYESITECSVSKISKTNFDFLNENTTFWAPLVKQITDEHLQCKLERVTDFQVLTAKQRYEKFVVNDQELALHVSIETIASYLGMQPQSLSRIRSQLTF